LPPRRLPTMNHPLFAMKHEHICPPYVNPQTTTYFPPTQKAMHNDPSIPQLAMVAGTVVRLSTSYSRMRYTISFMPFMLLILISSRRGLPRNCFSPSTICGLFNSPYSVNWPIRSSTSMVPFLLNCHNHHRWFSLRFPTSCSSRQSYNSIFGLLND